MSRGRPVGSNVGLYVDSPTELAPGDLVTTEAGRAYRVTAVRVQEGGRYAGRQHLRAQVLPGPPPGEAPTLQLRWYVRRRRAR